MIDLEKYWIAWEEVIKKKHEGLSFWDEMEQNGWELINSHGNLNGFYTHLWESETYKSHFLLEIREDDIGEFFLIPDRLQSIVNIWIISNVPSYKNKRDCIDGKWHYQLEHGWFEDPHMCQGIPCKRCAVNAEKRKANERGM